MENEQFDGLVDKIDGDVAYVTLKDKNGNIYLAEFDAKELAEKGICERRRFICSVTIELTAIPDKIITPEEEAEIHNRIEAALGDE